MTFYVTQNTRYFVEEKGTLGAIRPVRGIDEGKLFAIVGFIGPDQIITPENTREGIVFHNAINNQIIPYDRVIPKLSRIAGPEKRIIATRFDEDGTIPALAIDNCICTSKIEKVE